MARTPTKHKASADLETMNRRARERQNGRKARQGTEAPKVGEGAPPSVYEPWRGLMRRLTPMEKATLKASMERFGAGATAITVEAETGYILGGMSRWDMAGTLGNRDRLQVLEYSTKGMSDDDKAQLVIALNATGRQLTAESIEQSVKALKKMATDLAADPKKSVRQIAAITGLPSATVQRLIADVPGRPTRPKVRCQQCGQMISPSGVRKHARAHQDEQEAKEHEASHDEQDANAPVRCELCGVDVLQSQAADHEAFHVEQGAQADDSKDAPEPPAPEPDASKDVAQEKRVSYDGFIDALGTAHRMATSFAEMADKNSLGKIKRGNLKVALQDTAAALTALAEAILAA